MGMNIASTVHVTYQLRFTFTYTASGLVASS
jgi:hypothetical protein